MTIHREMNVLTIPDSKLTFSSLLSNVTFCPKVIQVLSRALRSGAVRVFWKLLCKDADS